MLLNSIKSTQMNTEIRHDSLVAFYWYTQKELSFYSIKNGEWVCMGWTLDLQSRYQTSSILVFST